MFNVTVLKMKDIKKYLLGMLATIVIVFIVSKYIPKNNNNSMLVCLEQTVPTVTNIEHEDEEEDYGEDIFLQSILKTQISSIQAIENIDNNVKNKEEVNTKEKEEPKQEVEMARNQFSNRSYYK